MPDVEILTKYPWLFLGARRGVPNQERVVHRCCDNSVIVVGLILLFDCHYIFLQEYQRFVMVTKSVLEKAVKQGILQQAQVAPLLAFLGEQNQTRIKATNVIYYVGGSLAIVALTLLLGLSWDRSSGLGLMVAALSSLALSAVFMIRLRKLQHHVPARLFGCLVISLVPIAIYGAQEAIGVWPTGAYPGSGHPDTFPALILGLEIPTLLVALLLLFFCRYPLFMLPIVLVLWSMAIDIVPGNFFTVTLWFGLAIAFLAVWIDAATRHTKDYAFWFYNIGVFCFWGGLTVFLLDGVISELFACIVSLLLMATGVVLNRRVFIVAGGIGVFLYIVYLAGLFIDNRWILVTLLALAGVGVIWLGLVWQKHERAVVNTLKNYLPGILHELINSRQR